MDHVELLGMAHAHSSAANVVTISIGVASQVPERGADPSDLVGLVDKALYTAKRDGRNRLGSPKARGRLWLPHPSQLTAAASSRQTVDARHPSDPPLSSLRVLHCSQDISHIPGKRTRKLHICSRNGMGEPQQLSMEHLTGE